MTSTFNNLFFLRNSNIVWKAQQSICDFDAKNELKISGFAKNAGLRYKAPLHRAERKHNANIIALLWLQSIIINYDFCCHETTSKGNHFAFSHNKIELQNVNRILRKDNWNSIADDSVAFRLMLHKFWESAACVHVWLKYQHWRCFHFHIRLPNQADIEFSLKIIFHF